MLPAVATAQAPPSAPTAITTASADAIRISPDAFRGHVETLAADDMEGRQAGTPGYDRAAAYVAQQFAAIGVQPANAGAWYQQVPLARRTVTRRGMTRTIRTLRPGPALPADVRVVGPAEAIESPNVVGFIPGTDPALASEYILLMAHLDHTGINPSARTGADRINNGALDNAAGVATMLEVARAFTEGRVRTRRPILFAAVTAEEDGLLGSAWLARNPLPGREVVAVVNLDMPVLLYDFTDVTAFGAEHSTMGPVVDAAARSRGVTLSPDPMPEENLFARSDHYSFVREGVPSVFLVTGFANGGEAAFRNFLATHYHRPSDDLNLPINWNAGAKFAEVNFAIARDLANADTAPRWYADSEFGTRFGGDSPRAERPAQ